MSPPPAKVWINGSLLEAELARVSAFDHGVTVGDGVFETLDVRRGVPFAIRRHLERLRTSAAKMGLQVPYEDELLRQAMTQTLQGSPDGRIRITVTSGPGPAGSARSPGVAPTVIVSRSPAAATEPTTKVVVVPWPRNERGALAGVKTTSYGENVVALAYAVERGGSEAIFGNGAGHLCEGTGSNVFVVIGGTVCTPPLGSGCLAGVTRALVCELLGDVVERDLPLDVLRQAEEMFLTSTTRDVQAVHAVNDDYVPTAPGPRTKEAARRLAELVARDLDP